MIIKTARLFIDGVNITDRPTVTRTRTGAWLVKGWGPTRRYSTRRQASRAANVHRAEQLVVKVDAADSMALLRDLEDGADLITRVVATASTGVVYAYGTAGAVVPITTPVRTSAVGVAFVTLGAIVVPAAPTTAYANVMEHATQMFDGVVVQSMLGATYASVFPTSRHHQQVRLADLDGLKIVDAKYDGGVLMVIAAAGGRYDRWTFGIAPGAEHATLIEKVEDVGTGGLDFVVLDSGVCVHFTEDDQLEMWSAREFQLEVWSAQKLGVSGPVAKKRVDVQSNGLRLVRRKGGLAGIRGSAAYVMRMKP